MKLHLSAFLHTVKFICLSAALLLSGIINAQTFPVGHMSINFKDATRTGGYVISGGINASGTGRDVGTEVYYPATVAGNNQPVANGTFPVVVIGHGFVMDWSAYDNIYNKLASSGYIVLLPRTEGSFSPSHGDFGNDLKFLVNAAQGLNTVSTPTALLTFNGKVANKSAIGGHSMGAGSSFLAAASNTSLTCLFNFAAATTNPSSITSAALVTVPSLIISGAIDCVADTTVQNSHYSALASNKKFHVILKQLTHCDFGNGTNFNCTFGQSTTGCGNVVSNSLAFPRYMNYVQNFLDNQLKNDCAAGQRFMDSVNTASSLRAGLKKLGSIACVSSGINGINNSIEARLYPNPTASQLMIETALNNFTVKVYDAYGKLLLNEMYHAENNSVQLNLADYHSGIYLIELEAEGVRSHFKVVKE